MRCAGPAFSPAELLVDAFGQAEKLDEMLEHRGAGIDKVLSFEVPDSVLVGAPNSRWLGSRQPGFCDFGMQCIER